MGKAAPERSREYVGVNKCLYDDTTKIRTCLFCLASPPQKFLSKSPAHRKCPKCENKAKAMVKSFLMRETY